VTPLSLQIDLTRTRTAPVAGTAHLTFARAGSRTILARSYATSPVKLFATRTQEPACWVYAATLGGGLVGGDELRTTIDVAPGARALLATQASTKVYRSLRPATQSISASIADDALLAVVPDPIVCYAGADFSQRQHYELQARGNLVVVDWITSGRHGSGERWAFARYESRIDFTRGGSRILYDGLVLGGAAGSVGERMGRFQVCLTAALTGPLVNEAATALVARTSQRPIVSNGDLIESAVPLADGGALLRIAGVSVEQVGQRLRDDLAFLLPLLGDDPWSRKW
jgi:urease accessory protein